MDNKREADFLARAKDAQEKSDSARDFSVKESWKRIAEDYRALADASKLRRF